jgi:4-amino-4-deoxychorismate lyase
MSQFIESIKVHNGEVLKLSLHQARFDRTREEVLGLRTHPDLSEFISVPDSSKQGVYKCRVLYGLDITQVKFMPYQKPQIRSLKLVKSDCISYAYKSADRTKLEALYEQRDACDDILIVKNGWITDSYFANVILWDGSKWVTPKEPLLKGCMRFSLLANGMISERAIHVNELSRYKHLRLINALNDLSDRLEISIHEISW